MALINRVRAAGLKVVVDLEERRGESLWQLAQRRGIDCAVDYGAETIRLWMRGNNAAGDSSGELSADALWQQLQRLALAKTADPAQQEVTL